MHSLHFGASTGSDLTHVNACVVAVIDRAVIVFSPIYRIVGARRVTKVRGSFENASFALFEPFDVVDARRKTSGRDAHVIAQLSPVNNPEQRAVSGYTTLSYTRCPENTLIMFENCK